MGFEGPMPMSSEEDKELTPEEGRELLLASLSPSEREAELERIRQDEESVKSSRLVEESPIILGLDPDEAFAINMDRSNPTYGDGYSDYIKFLQSAKDRIEAAAPDQKEKIRDEYREKIRMAVEHGIGLSG